MRLHKRALGTSIKYLYNRYLLNNFGHFRNFIVSFLFYHRFLLYPLKASNSLSLSLSASEYSYISFHFSKPFSFLR